MAAIGTSGARRVPLAVALHEAGAVMSFTVRDIMNPQLLYVLEGDAPEMVCAKLLRFGVSGAPVLDALYRPTGFVSLRDIAADGKSLRISRPVVTTHEDEPIEAAARALADADLRHLVVVDRGGKAVGVVSAVDFVRALSGLPPHHPPRFDVDCSSAAAFPDDAD
jgi:CBS domain-containing protein